MFLLSFLAANKKQCILQSSVTYGGFVTIVTDFCNMFETFLSNDSHIVLTSTLFLCAQKIDR